VPNGTGRQIRVDCVLQVLKHSGALVAEEVAGRLYGNAYGPMSVFARIFALPHVHLSRNCAFAATSPRRNAILQVIGREGR
jgi:hypothetical protein